MKALAISAIVFHNYFHVLGNSIHENEFDFEGIRLWNLVGNLSDPLLTIESLFCFFGHFGVQVFIFLSAYGLAKRHWNQQLDWREFFFARIKKLYPVFALVIVPWFVLDILVRHTAAAGPELLLMALGISPLIPGHGMPPVGPWWFIPFTIEFYACWTFVPRLVNRFGRRGLVIVAVSAFVLVYFLNPILLRFSIAILETPIGHLPELCLGVLAARFPTQPRISMAIGASAVVLLGSLMRSVWPLTFVAALITFLVVYVRFRGGLRSNRVLIIIGRYSLLIFLLNGIVRFLFFWNAASPLMQITCAILSAVATFMLALLIHVFLAPKLAPRYFQAQQIAFSDLGPIPVRLIGVATRTGIEKHA